MPLLQLMEDPVRFCLLQWFTERVATNKFESTIWFQRKTRESCEVYGLWHRPLKFELALSNIPCQYYDVQS